jgi:cytochrome c
MVVRVNGGGRAGQALPNARISIGSMAGISYAIVAFAVLTIFSTAALAEGDPAAGKRVFAKCALCHTAEPGKNKIGPSLFNVIGRAAASAPGYSYSTAMSGLNRTWDTATLNEYLASPKALVPGTKMTFPGIPDKQDRDDVIAYLSTLR